MLDDLAFLEVIRQSPADDGPRLIYADYLEEKGDAAGLARAEFIRLQCLAASGLTGRAAAQAREKALLDQNWRVWMRPVCQALGEPVPMGFTQPIQKASFEETARRDRYFLKRVANEGPWTHSVEQYWMAGRAVPYLHSAQFRRGFVSHVTLAAKTYRNEMHVARLSERAPLEGLAVVGCTPAQFAGVLAAVDFSHLRTLELIFTDPAVVRLAVSSPALAHLDRLIVRHMHGTDDACAALTAGRELAGLKHLLVRSCHVTAAGMEELAAMPYFSRLETLGFPDCVGLDHRVLETLRRGLNPARFRRLTMSQRAADMPPDWRFDTLLEDGEFGWPELYQF